MGASKFTAANTQRDAIAANFKGSAFTSVRSGGVLSPKLKAPSAHSRRFGERLISDNSTHLRAVVRKKPGKNMISSRQRRKDSPPPTGRMRRSREKATIFGNHALKGNEDEKAIESKSSITLP